MTNPHRVLPRLNALTSFLVLPIALLMPAGGPAAQVSSSPDWAFESNSSNANLWSVATAGDINGDGYDDLIVGAANYTPREQGRVWAFAGSSTGAALTPFWSFDGEGPVSQLGARIAAAGDVNGDGFDDVLVAAPTYSGALATQGKVYLFHGSAQGLAAQPSWTAVGDRPGAFLGAGLASAGDVNGDGYADVIVGAPSYDVPQAGTGRVYVYLGSASGLAAAPQWSVRGKEKSALFGGSVASAGDVNGDGYDDVVVGAFDSARGKALKVGRAFVYLGAPNGLSNVHKWSAQGDQEGEEFGVSVDSAGDVNGDGFSDVVVGAWRYDGAAVDSGRALLYEGSASGLSITPSWTVEGNQPEGYFGAPARGAQDLNGDGFDDVVFGSHQATIGSGQVFVYLGSSLGLSLTPDQILSSLQSNDGFGLCAPGGDVNGDGLHEVAVGAPYYSNGESAEGVALLYHGSAP